VVPRVVSDERGYFQEVHKSSEYEENGIGFRLVQSNHSCSSRGVARGLHYQLPPHEQGKLVWVAKGAVWDVALDLRPGSLTFGKWFGLELSDDNHRVLWIPGGFAHGFVALQDDTHLLYQCTSEYNKESEAGIFWNDPELGIAWPQEGIEVSDKDRALPRFRDARYFPENYHFR